MGYQYLRFASKELEPLVRSVIHDHWGDVVISVKKEGDSYYAVFEGMTGQLNHNEEKDEHI